VEGGNVPLGYDASERTLVINPVALALAASNPTVNRGRPGSFFLDLGEQTRLNRGGCPLSLHIVTGKTAGPDNYRGQLDGAAATRVVEAHKRRAALTDPECLPQPGDRLV
jgi:hypothetical protein